jgi:hypothetical protein
MRTDQLIALMTADHGKIEPGALRRATWAAAAVTLVVCGLFVLVTVGGRADLASAWSTLPVLAKALLGAGVAAFALVVFQRSLRPGVKPGWPAWLVAAPIVAVACLALLALSQAPVERWGGMVFGRHWLVCLVAVPLYSLVPLAALVAVARRGAPVDQVFTGAFAGLAAAGLATTAYSLHCPDDAMPFLATWYPLAMAIVTGLGALVFPRLVRW